MQIETNTLPSVKATFFHTNKQIFKSMCMAQKLPASNHRVQITAAVQVQEHDAESTHMVLPVAYNACNCIAGFNIDRSAN